jgi:endonuclease/exonuclease/phosphatase family metal-dependent hydrolase
MSLSFLAGACGALVIVTPALSQDVNVGDEVALVEREIHIPAHPAPGDNHVPFRFTSGSSGIVLSIDPSTGWIQLRGEVVGGTEGVGWITSTYIAGPATGAVSTVEPPELGWCLPKGSPDTRPGGRLRIATWNLGNLHAEDGGSTFLGPDPSVKRFSIDYSRIRCYVRLFDPDILAVQEVDGEEALRRIVDGDVYDVHVSSRPKPGFMGGKQNTGFAYRKGLSVTIQPDVTELDVSNGDLRYGTRIDVAVNGETLSLMSVHLKSGCFDNASSGSACNTLFTQIPKLEAWIDKAAGGDHPFIVLGDFNRRLNLPDDLVWKEIDDGVPPNADLLAVTEDMPISCRDNSFTSFIDHIVVDKRAAQFVDRTSFRHVTYRQDEQEVWDKISDHCPVVVELWVP